MYPVRILMGVLARYVHHLHVHPKSSKCSLSGSFCSVCQSVYTASCLYTGSQMVVTNILSVTQYIITIEHSSLPRFFHRSKPY